MKLFNTSLILIIIFASFINGQNKQQKFQVDFNEIKGELTLKDQFKKDFGRYDGYQIELYEGEAVNFIVYSNNFQPSLAFVNPKGEVYKQSSVNDKNYANIVTTVPASGEWVLYVVGNEKTVGSYTLQTAIAEPNALSLPINSDFCTTLDFLFSHANAYFFLLENPAIIKQQLVKLNESFDAYIDEEDGSYNAAYYDGNDLLKAEQSFKNISDKIKMCLDKDWQYKIENWKKVEDYKAKSITLTEKTNDKPRHVMIAIYDFSGSNQNNRNRFSVVVEINRKH